MEVLTERGISLDVLTREEGEFISLPDPLPTKLRAKFAWRYEVACVVVVWLALFPALISDVFDGRRCGFCFGL